MATTVINFIGHIVHCKDLDGGTEFNIEVLINAEVKDLISACEKAAKKNELVDMTGNKFEFEYLQVSGRLIKKTVTTEREELSPISPECEKMLGLTHLE